MKASDLFLRCLEKQGVDTIFGVPGEENADLMIALLNSNITFITCRHEQSAAFMADMYGRLTGKPGVCLATLGPGATNLVTGVANANMDRVPLIAIVGQASTSRLHKESHQNMDAVEMFRPITKWATSIRSATVIPEIIYKAFKVALTPKAGAVLIELPEDIAKHEVDLEPLVEANPQCERDDVSSHSLNETLKLIAESKTPMLLVGYGANYESCDDEIKEFMDKTGMYAAATFMGKGSVSAHHPQSLFTVGLGMRDIAMEAFDRADLVICIGYGLVEWLPERWNEGCKKKIIHIDTAAAEVDAHYLPELELIGGIKGILKNINERLTPAQKKDANYFAAIHNKCTLELLEHEHDEHFPIKPQRILSELRKSLRDDDILISDVGAHKMWVARQFPAYRSKSCFIYNGFCSMGGSMPGAFVAKRLYPEKRVVALCGDGGFTMSIQSLITAVEYKVPMVVMVWQDNCYGLIKWKQEMEFHQHSHVDLINPDLVQVAKALGCHSLLVSKPQEILPALQNAFKETQIPTVIVIPVDYSENMKLTERLGKILSH